ncbi:hypothetical protein [Campylobacter pinnipediorum]|uniref:Uncharacterized protein n=1 Tax=Campylobacter pinnipediorum subsp. pinnipediorum TaxID=1660067 RepID=A0AAX0LB76_9BACT|nr:hypothetical protein [Campylobacter pinnipediorum]AQW82899.1 hypothetical protein CPIN17261_0889 [Campylobacter pinnipediorum subsp. pinnipediorum]OPA77241.1 hypothetical protein BFG04_03860 [Campylobacter pinnipediorum subsp. pinnipediorum]
MNKYELMGRIVEQKEIAAKTKEALAELKEAIVSSFNREFLPSVWDELTKNYKNKSILLSNTFLKIKEYEDELKTLGNENIKE